ncbi:MAG: SUMF1/EgtB/PvdO family nonheme iron enzyme [Planctomycetia bacterium]|nr:SUMF1/EgtB/PvdO family nonheme iron enzyme [Planctomycetia bacterium]
MEKRAFLFGINEYRALSHLSYARQDAEAVANALKEFYQFKHNEVVLATCQGKNIRPDTKFDILECLTWAEPLDLLVVGFWGHGAWYEGKRYLCLTGTRPNSMSDTAISLEEIRDAIRQIPAKNVCIILDCCQSSADGRMGISPTLEIGARDIVLEIFNPEHLQRNNEPIIQTVAILNSCSEGECAYEWGEKSHGFFTQHLLEALESAEPRVTNIFSYVRRETVKSASAMQKRQSPFYEFRGDSEIFLPAQPETVVSSTPVDTQTDTPSGFGSPTADTVPPLREEIPSSIQVEILPPLRIYVPEAPQNAPLILSGEILYNIALEHLEMRQYAVAKKKIDEALHIEPLNEKFLSLRNTILELMEPPVEPVFFGRYPGDRLTKTVYGVEFAWRWCPPGEFVMGGWHNAHHVRLTRGFWMLETQVTQRMWKAIMGYNPSYFVGDDLPVEQINWHDSINFCRELGNFSGLQVQLPTEAQWEYACCAGPTGVSAANLNSIAWHGGHTPIGAFFYRIFVGRTQPVGRKIPNEWGLFDMHGNVWEWCADRYAEYPGYAVTDPVGPTATSADEHRIFRGGSWRDHAKLCHSAYRNWGHPEHAFNGLGVRPIFFPLSLTNSFPFPDGIFS